MNQAKAQRDLSPASTRRSEEAENVEAVASTNRASNSKRGREDNEEKFEGKIKKGDVAATTTDSSSASSSAVVKKRKEVNEEGPVIFSNGMVEFSLASINSHLICGLCGGYYKDPYTITECLHTFCKSCLFYAVACGCHECPDCEVYLGNDPLKVAVLDHALQHLLDHIIFPDVVKEEEAQERAFYASRAIRLKPEYQEDKDGTIRPASTSEKKEKVIIDKVRKPVLFCSSPSFFSCKSLSLAVDIRTTS